MPSKDSDLSKGTVVFDHKNNYRCCGIQYKKWVLTSGLILCPYVSPDDLGLIQNEQYWTFNDDDDNNVDKQLFLSDIDDNIMRKISKKKFKVLLKDHTENQYVDYRKKLCKGTNLDLNISSNDNISTVDSYNAHPLTVFRSDIVNHYVQDHFSDWQLCNSQDQFDDISSDLIQNLLSVFLILQIGDTDEIYDNQIPLNYFLRLTNNENYMRRGLDIIVESTPFAIPQFFNTWSKGIISNTIDHTGCLFYTDTRLVIGCVGAPVYRYKQGNNKGGLLGMILNPMLWSQGEWAGFSVAVDLHIILKEVIHDKNPIHRNYFNAFKKISTHKLIEDLDKSVVLVRCNHNWGSGVVVNKKHGIIITCAHVVNYLEEQTVKIECGSFKTTAKVIYCNKPGEVFDIAVLSSEPLFNSKEVSFTNEPPIKGETVFCVGYPMVDTSQVTLSKGIIANVEPDTFIQTTCCVQSGASGGAIIRPSGVLVGIPVSNMSCASTHALYPHCNLSIPATIFADALTKYFTTKDISCLKKLTSRNPHVQQKWLLQHKCKI